MKNTKLPSKLKQVNNLLKSVGRAIKLATDTGEIVAPKEVVEKRILTCEGCEYRSKKTNRCTECGCYLSLKTGLAAEFCPKGKW